MGSASLGKIGVVLASLPAKFTSKVCEIAMRTKKLGQDDPRRITHSLKVGFALTLVSLFYYYQPLYNSFGASAMWAVVTVIVVFEFSVGTYGTIYECSWSTSLLIKLNCRWYIYINFMDKYV